MASDLERKDEFRGYPNKLRAVSPVSAASGEGTMEALLRCKYEEWRYHSPDPSQTCREERQFAVQTGTEGFWISRHLRRARVLEDRS